MGGATERVREEDYNPNAGWIAAGLIVAAVLAVGAAFWFTYHPI